MREGPSTVHKALSLLNFFSERRPWIGLSELAKLSGFNKATTLRFLSGLEARGFVEQDEDTRTYTIGPAFLRFARLRESIYPLEDAVQSLLTELSAATGETAHASVIAGDALANIGTVESRRANRVIIEAGEALPLHATASGLAYLAFAPDFVVENALSGKLEAHGAATLTDPDDVRAALERVRTDGYAESTATYEDGVTGMAAPFYGAFGRVRGTVAVAMPTIRATDERKKHVLGEVLAAASNLTKLCGGRFPADHPATLPTIQEEKTS
jgi:IclR family transcriptional regulator, acetate operon repressor